MLQSQPVSKVYSPVWGLHHLTKKTFDIHECHILPVRRCRQEASVVVMAPSKMSEMEGEGIMGLLHFDH